MKRLAALLCAWALASPVHAADGTPLDIRLTAQVDIAPDGTLRALQWHDTSAAARLVTQRIEPLVRGWAFEAGRKDGAPAETRTHLRVHVRAQARADQSVALQLVDANTGLHVAGMVVPRYPGDALRGSTSALVMAVVDVDALRRPSVRSLEVIRGGRHRADFDEAVRQAVAEWQVVPEAVGGEPVAGSLRIPFLFCVRRDDCRTLEERSEAMTGQRGTHAQPLDSVAKLLTPIDGTWIDG